MKRSELYAKVWAMPVLKIATEVGITGTKDRGDLQAAWDSDTTARLLGQAVGGEAAADRAAAEPRG